MNFLDEIFPNVNHFTKKAIIGVLVALLLFSIGFGNGAASNQINATLEGANAPAANQAVVATQPAATQPATTQPAATQPAGNDAPSQDAAPTEKPEGGDASGSLSTPAEIIAYFNESANKVKTNATSVTRNWEDLHADNEYLEVPSALQSIGKTLMNTFLKKDETPITWASQAEIIENYPVAKQNFVSNAREADVAEATCNDDGTYYNITLKFNECTDPQGTGCANAFNVINADDVYSNASVVQNFTCKYYDAKIECKIEKATGNLVAATYTLPIIMNVSAKVLVTLDAQVGMTFIDDYTIAY